MWHFLIPQILRVWWGGPRSKLDVYNVVEGYCRHLLWTDSLSAAHSRCKDITLKNTAGYSLLNLHCVLCFSMLCWLPSQKFSFSTAVKKGCFLSTNAEMTLIIERQPIFSLDFLKWCRICPCTALLRLWSVYSWIFEVDLFFFLTQTTHSFRLVKPSTQHLL